MIDFKNIAYLKDGTERQVEAFEVLQALGVFQSLDKYQPVLTGTIPIAIDIADSDLDIICYAKDISGFEQDLYSLFSDKMDFNCAIREVNTVPSVIAKFRYKGFEIEVFGQDIPVLEQNAYRHMLIEHRILMEKGEAFRKNIIELKEGGMKTEPAFAKLLGLKGDPYETLLSLDI